MTTDDQQRLDRRLLLLPPTPKDGRVTQDVLRRAGVETELCATVRALVNEAQRGAAAVLLPEEAIAVASRQLTADALAAGAMVGSARARAHAAGRRFGRSLAARSRRSAT